MGGPVRDSKAKEQQGQGRAAIGPAAQNVERSAHPILQMQSTVGNQAVQRMLGTGTVQRQPAPGGPAGGQGGGRTILIDANVIGEINRGNAQAAQTLLALRGNNKVYISRQAFNELTSQPGTMIAGVGPDLPRTAAANRLLLQDLGIEVAPSGAAPDRIAVHDTNIAKMKGNISAQDLAHVAQAKAIGAEVWSLDRAFRKQASMIEKQLGVKVAPETVSTPLVGQKAGEDYRVARKLLNLGEVEITVGGVVKKTPPPTPIGGGGSVPPKTPAPSGPTGPIKPPSGGASSASAARSIAREAARQAATDMRLLKAARVLATASQVLQGVSALKTLDKFMGMTRSKLAGGGFILNAQIAQANALRKEAEGLASSYETFSESVGISTYRLMGASADPLSAGQAGSHVADLLDQLTDLRRDLGERIQSLDHTLNLVRLKREAALNILNSRQASGMIAAVTFGTAELAELFAVSEDLLMIQGGLNGAVSSFRKVSEQLDSDIYTLNEWSEALFKACEKGGYCSTGYIHIPFVGDSRIRGYPGEE